MLNPRLPILAGGVALLALALAQVFGWSDWAGFLFGWLLLVAILVHRQVIEFARSQAARLALRLAVVARLTALERRHLHLRLPQVQMWRATGAAKRTPQMQVPNDGS